MSGTPADAFRPALRRLAEGLSLPLYTRLRILREMEADLADTVERLVAAGVPVDEARARAGAVLLPDSESLEALHRVHEPLYRRLTRHVDQDRLERVERLGLVLATAAVVAAGTVGLLQVDVLDRPSPYLWPVLALGATALGVGLAKVFQLWLRGEHRSPARGLWLIPAAAGAGVAIAVHGALRGLMQVATHLETAPARETAALLTRWLARDGALVSVALLVALAAAVGWFGLAQWVSLVEEGQRAVLGPGIPQEPLSHAPTSAPYSQLPDGGYSP